MPKIERTCVVCGKSFFTPSWRIKQGKGKYCSPECRHLGKRRGKSRNCLQCGKEFYASLGATKKGGGLFCSHDCACKHISNRPDQKITRTCEQCGRQFQSWPSRVEAGAARFCSEDCHNKHQTDRIKTTCATCGKEFETKPGRIAKGWGQYCSRRCFHLGRQKRVTRTCLQCGTTFTVHEYEFRRGGGRFCSYSCNHIYSGPTSIETVLRQCLDNLGVEYKSEYPIRRFTIDAFVVPNYVFEADGTYWHALPETIEKDKRRDKWLTDHGYIVTRFSESILRNNQTEVMRIIAIVLSLPNNSWPVQLGFDF